MNKTTQKKSTPSKVELNVREVSSGAAGIAPVGTYFNKV